MADPHHASDSYVRGSQDPVVPAGRQPGDGLHHRGGAVGGRLLRAEVLQEAL